MLSICQNWPARPSLSYWEFHFKSKLSSQISQIINSIHQGDGFSAKTLSKKPISYANWLVQQWSSRPVLTNGKRPKTCSQKWKINILNVFSWSAFWAMDSSFIFGLCTLWARARGWLNSELNSELLIWSNILRCAL